MAKRTPIEQRFWKRVRKTSYCWVWTGCKNAFGYGMIGKGGRGAGQYIASRFSYQLHNGNIPKGKSVLHKCDNPACVNPNHLFIGTQSDNLKDMDSKGRRGWYDKSGENNPNYGKHFKEKSKQRMRDKMGAYCQITSPSGEIVRFLGIRKFAISHNLNVGHLSMLRRNIVRTCKGYTNFQHIKQPISPTHIVNFLQ